MREDTGGADKATSGAGNTDRARAFTACAGDSIVTTLQQSERDAVMLLVSSPGATVS